MRSLDDAERELAASRRHLEAASRHLTDVFNIVRRLHSLEDTNPRGKKRAT
jgi:hypothetical protein